MQKSISKRVRLATAVALVAGVGAMSGWRWGQREAPASGEWIVSDQAQKENILPVNRRSTLERVERLPVPSWSYKGEKERHLGPMAQDFFALFGVGATDRIQPADLAGVALLAIQEISQRQSEAQRRLDTQERDLAKIKRESSALSQGTLPSSDLIRAIDALKREVADLKRDVSELQRTKKEVDNLRRELDRIKSAR